MATQELVKIELAGGSSIELDWSQVGPRREIYTHVARYNTNGKLWKAAGDVVARGQFGPQMLAQFMDNGNFPWPPGAECLKNKWTPRWGARQGKVQWGCKPCRDMAGGAVPAAGPPPAVAGAAPLPKETNAAVNNKLFSYNCPWCPVVVLGQTEEKVAAALTKHRADNHFKKPGRPRKEVPDGN